MPPEVTAGCWLMLLAVCAVHIRLHVAWPQSSAEKTFRSPLLVGTYRDPLARAGAALAAAPRVPDQRCVPVAASRALSRSCSGCPPSTCRSGANHARSPRLLGD